MSMIDPRARAGTGQGQQPVVRPVRRRVRGRGGRVRRLPGAAGGAPASAVDDVGDDAGEQIAYEYDDLDADARFIIDRVLADAGIVHAWEGTSLVVAPYDSGGRPAARRRRRPRRGHRRRHRRRPAGEEGVEQVVYDLEDWDADRRAELDGRLEAEGIAHAFDETGDLVVLEADEDRVDGIIDAIDYPDQLEAEAGDAGGLDAVEALGNLFVATDRLVHDPSDTDGTLAAVDSARVIADMPTPFGFGPPMWAELCRGRRPPRAARDRGRDRRRRSGPRRRRDAAHRPAPVRVARSRLARLARCSSPSSRSSTTGPSHPRVAWRSGTGTCRSTPRPGSAPCCSVPSPRSPEELDAEDRGALRRLMAHVEAGGWITVQVRHRFQTDTHGLARRGGLRGTGDSVELDVDGVGTPLQLTLASVYAAGQLAPEVRPRVLDVIRRGLAWRGPVRPAAYRHLAGPPI